MRVVRILFLFAGLVAVGMGLVALRTDARQAGYLVSRSWAEQQDLKRRCFELELEVARMMSPVRLQAESKRLELESRAPGDVEPPLRGGAGVAAHE